MKLDQWIDLSLVRSWIDDCERNHHECRSLEHLTQRPAWLIDVEEQCLVPAGQGSRYLALSYVWGSVPSLQTSRANQRDLQVPGALSQSPMEEQIPLTIRDAMGLTRSLKVRYLWVDSLCICQDDEDLKHTQLEAMGSIYANAVVTIVAASGHDAAHGLCGLEGITPPRRVDVRYTDDFWTSLVLGTSFWVSPYPFMRENKRVRHEDYCGFMLLRTR
jgi:hypothetical protein